MFRGNLFFNAAVLFMTAMMASSQYTSEAFASGSESDKEIYREARKVVIPHDIFSNSVAVSVREHVVTISGYIDSQNAKREIGESIAAISGVKKVRNDVIVRVR